MDLSLYTSTLQKKYNYDDKTISALKEVVLAMIEYYGEEYSNIIFDALDKTEIITCNSEQTISTVIDEKIKTKELLGEKNGISIIKEDKAIQGGKYISQPKIEYDPILKSYVIVGINRFIILSHTYNLDSARGKAALTREIIKLVKSYKDEYRIDNDIITRRQGIKEEKKKINSVDKKSFYLNLFSEKNAALQEGFDIYDEEQIVSIILNDKYKSMDYRLLKDLATVLNEKLHLKDDIRSSEFKKTKSLQVEFDKEDDMFKTLIEYSYQAAKIENKMNPLYSNRIEIEVANVDRNVLIDKLVELCLNYRNLKKHDEEAQKGM